MPLTTPFHERLVCLNETGIWKNWSGFLVAPQYQYSVCTEYYAIRNSAGLLDTSPLFKYSIGGSDSREFLQHVLARDIRTCRPGTAQYTCWCNDAGFVIQDGVVLHVDTNEYLLTTAEPTLHYFRRLGRKMELGDLQIDDVSPDYGILALQGPHSLDVLEQLTDQVSELAYFEATKTAVQDRPVIISRTGFTGDLGYEIWVKKEDALTVWDALIQAGEGFNMTPLGTTALKMARVEAGLLLMDVDFHSARFAWVDAQRETPCELGWNWMFRKLASDDRDFIGRTNVESGLAARSSRWTTVGLEVDWYDYEKVHLDAGIAPPKHGVYHESTMSVYRRNSKQGSYAGYVSSFLYSSLLRKPVAIAKLPLDLAVAGTEVNLEISVIRRPVNVLARVVEMPFVNPERKTARPKSKYHVSKI